jgi:hypothetical protein
MSAAAAPLVEDDRATHSTPGARVAVLVSLGAVGLLGAALLALSVVPSSVLAGRLLGAAGEARGGAYALELASYLDERLLFSSALLFGFAVGLLVLRSQLEDLIAAAARESSWPRGFPSVRSLGLVGLPTLVAVALRLVFLSQPMRYDEALTFNEFASRPLYYGLSFYPDPNNHLLNTLLMHLAFVGLGNEPWVLRLPAFVAGVLVVPATYALAHLLFDQRAAFASALLVAVSSYLIEYSTNARGYTWQVLSSVLLLSLVVVAVRRDSRAALLLGSIVAAVGMYAVPTMLYSVIVAAVWLLISLRGAALTRIRLSHLVAAGLVLGLLVVLVYLPVLLISGADKLASNRFVVPLGLADLADQLPRSLAHTWALWNRDVPLPVAALLVVGFLIGSLRVRLGVVAMGVCLVSVLLQRVAPFERVWLFLLPLYFTIASGGLARFVDGRLLGIVFAAVLGFFSLSSGSILSSPETGTFPDAEAVARTLGPRLAPDDAVLTQLPASLPELQYYFPKFQLPTNVLVRSPDEAQNLYIIAPSDAEPVVTGWQPPVEVQRFGGSTLYELKRSPGGR